MKEFKVKVYPSKVNLPKENQLAYRIAKVASDNSPIDNKAADMVINRIIDNASVAIASFSRQPVTKDYVKNTFTSPPDWTTAGPKRANRKT